MDFKSFPKMPRYSREIIITEKIDGTNAQIFIDENFNLKVGSRERWISVEDDNYGFAAWVYENYDEILKLGPGRHFGEWWGFNINREYGLKERKFSLFNSIRWKDNRPACCDVVPILYQGIFSEQAIINTLESLKQNGSIAAKGFMDPEGVIIYHLEGGIGFKKTIKDDNISKSKLNK